MQHSLLPLSKRREKRHLLVENKVSFHGPESVLSVYDTYRSASRVGLDAEQLLFCGMVKGRKIMHDAHHEKGLVFLPHESYVMPPGEYVEIDFPEANEQQPTTCLTIEIDKERVEFLSERMRAVTTLGTIEHDWQYQSHVVHTHHTSETQQLLERLVKLFSNNSPDKEILIDLGVTELIIRLLRQQGREVLLDYCRHTPDASSITTALSFITQNFSRPLNIEQLCRRACMSRSKLYVEFKKQVGCSPGEYQQQLRLKLAAEAIENGKTISEACYSVGFNDLSHFSRRFSLFFGCTPSVYKNKITH